MSTWAYSVVWEPTQTDSSAHVVLGGAVLQE